MNTIREACSNFLLYWWRKVKRNPIKTIVIVYLAGWYYWFLPDSLFHDPYSVVVESRDGYLLGAKIAEDGQWRFPQVDSVPEKYKHCVLTFEDQYFYQHPGINPVSIINALFDNLKSGRVVRGGSTITQQVVRLARKGQERSYGEKFVEMIWATRMEFRYTKDEILRMYASHAPFGGNVVGIEMASWRYFGVAPHQLSWAEAATLAVLPNAPSLIYPGKNQDKLRVKRNKLLERLKTNDLIDEMTYQLAISEPLPSKPFPLPDFSKHLVEKIASQSDSPRFTSTIDYTLQQRLSQITANFHSIYSQNEVHNMAILVVEVDTRNVIGYIGNTPTGNEHGKDVDIIPAPRSTGSVLKPLLFAEMLNEGMLLPDMLIPDIPTQISGFTPQNFNSTYDGAVPARNALSRSLNIPAVLSLQKYGVNSFYEDLRFYGQEHINKHPGYYGLSLILGGAESSLWDMCKVYANYASTLNYYSRHEQRYRRKEFQELSLSKDEEKDFGTISLQPTKVDAGSIYETFKAMQEVNRTAEDEAWKFYSSSRKISWKTGTSFGNRDAWAIGVSPDYVVGVWVGNANGEGRPQLTGVGYASPVLFDVFNLLPVSQPFRRPETGMLLGEICTKSGFLAGPNCTSELKWIPKRGEETEVCPYHHTITVDLNVEYRINTSCASPEEMKTIPWFTLPPVMEFYFKKRNAFYKVLPPFREGCSQDESGIAFIYPRDQSVIYLTKDFYGNVQPLIAKVAHRNPDKTLFWYLNDTYLGETKHIHEMSIIGESGDYRLTVVDEDGRERMLQLSLVNENQMNN